MTGVQTCALPIFPLGPLELVKAVEAQPRQDAHAFLREPWRKRPRCSAPYPACSSSRRGPGPSLLTVTSQQATYLYSTTLPQTSMYRQRNQKLWFLTGEKAWALGTPPGQEGPPVLPALTRVADYYSVPPDGLPNCFATGDRKSVV